MSLWDSLNDPDSKWSEGQVRCAIEAELMREMHWRPDPNKSALENELNLAIDRYEWDNFRINLRQSRKFKRKLEQMNGPPGTWNARAQEMERLTLLELLGVLHDAKQPQLVPFATREFGDRMFNGKLESVLKSDARNAIIYSQEPCMFFFRANAHGKLGIVSWEHADGIRISVCNSKHPTVVCTTIESALEELFKRLHLTDAEFESYCRVTKERESKN